ncbi:MAG TPA: signal peptidase II [Candidatus Cybelea sp.]|nr:signal peptidase II [Candidatus Cybelea sp.]
MKPRGMSRITIADRRLFRLGTLVAVGLIAADQATKALMLQVMEAHPFGIQVLPFFSLVAAWNPGVSFSLLRHAGTFVLAGGAIAVSLALLFWLTRVEALVTAIGIGCVAGGAIGNVIDRVRAGAVFDFLDFYIRLPGSQDYYHWPAFNLADSCITVGVLLLLYDGLFHRVDRAKTEQS